MMYDICYRSLEGYEGDISWDYYGKVVRIVGIVR